MKHPSAARLDRHLTSDPGAPLALAALLLAAPLPACDAASRASAAPGVGGYHRPPGMPIGTGASGGLEDPLDDDLPPPAELADNSDLPIPEFTPPSVEPPVPCDACLELRVHVDDINQRDEFALPAGGTPITRVVWTLRVTFNSDQLAVQPFIDDQRGKYTNLHVNTFPLGEPVPLEQTFDGPARTIGLVVGSSGAWTGNQTMSVFIDSVHIDGTPSRTLTFDDGPDGLAPRTRAHDPHVVHHPAR